MVSHSSVTCIKLLPCLTAGAKRELDDSISWEACSVPPRRGKLTELDTPPVDSGYSAAMVAGGE